MSGIIFDPGHGGRDSGAVGPTGLRECDVALKLGLMLREIFWGESILTRSADVTVSLASRAACATRDFDAFVSLHCNSVADSSPSGFEIFTTLGVTQAEDLASSIFRLVQRSSPPERRFRADLTDGDPDKEANFYVLKHTPIPAVLVEVAFISNPAEEQLLRDDTYLRWQASAIAAGIWKWRAKTR